MAKYFICLGDLLRAARLKKGMTQSELGQEIGDVHSQFVSNWERGICAPPSDSKRKLARVLDIDEESLWEAIMDDHGYEVTEEVRQEYGLKNEAPVRKLRSVK